MLSLINRLASSVRQRNIYVHTKNGTGFMVQHYRSASVKLTPHDVNAQFLLMNFDHNRTVN